MGILDKVLGREDKDLEDYEEDRRNRLQADEMIGKKNCHGSANKWNTHWLIWRPHFVF